MMNKISIAFIFCVNILLTGCDFIGNTFKYKDTTKEFVDALLKKDYDNCVNYMAMDHEMAKNINVDTMKMVFANFREKLVNSFGSDLEYSFMKAEKSFSTNEIENSIPNTTKVLVEFSNKKEFGVFNLLFDDKSHKILNIGVLDVKEPIPNMTLFWLVGLFALSIPVFNIYVIRKVKQSELKKKWVKYIAILFLNVPSLTYSVIGGLSFNLLNFQILFGISFEYMGYLNSAWTIGLPLGGIYWLRKLKANSKITTELIIETDKIIETTSERKNDLY